MTIKLITHIIENIDTILEFEFILSCDQTYITYIKFVIGITIFSIYPISLIFTHYDYRPLVMLCHGLLVMGLLSCFTMFNHLLLLLFIFPLIILFLFLFLFLLLFLFLVCEGALLMVKHGRRPIFEAGSRIQLQVLSNKISLPCTSTTINKTIYKPYFYSSPYFYS